MKKCLRMKRKWPKATEGQIKKDRVLQRQTHPAPEVKGLTQTWGKGRYEGITLMWGTSALSLWPWRAKIRSWAPVCMRSVFSLRNNLRRNNGTWGVYPSCPNKGGGSKHLPYQSLGAPCFTLVSLQETSVYLTAHRLFAFKESEQCLSNKMWSCTLGERRLWPRTHTELLFQTYQQGDPPGWQEDCLFI